MLEGDPANAEPLPILIFAVIVLYKMRLLDSPSYTSLLAAFGALQHGEVELQILLYDNTPSATSPGTLPPFVRYVASPINTGLATAYNLATREAKSQGYPWLLTLDQDTALPESFLRQIAAAAKIHDEHANIAAIVPYITSGMRAVSPNWFVADVKPRWFPQGFCGVPPKAVYALNSGSLVRVSAVQEVGGYSKLFWLDAADIYLFNRFEQSGRQVYVAGNIHVHHDLSLTNVQGKMSLARYRNALASGSAFFDLERTSFAGAGHTLVLLGLYLKQLVRREEVTIRQSTLALVRSRLLQPRRRRLKAWLASEERRIADWAQPLKLLESSLHNDAMRKHAATPDPSSEAAVSILAVIVLYRMSAEDSPAYRSLIAAAQQLSEPVRLQIVLYNNGPDKQSDSIGGPNVLCVEALRNQGVSGAYNYALTLAVEDQFEWLLTLDQDTVLPAAFLNQMTQIARDLKDQSEVAAILPLVVEGPRVLSPHWFKFDFFAKPFSRDTQGIQQHSAYAFNSGSVLRRSALQKIGGYSSLFWLDYSDAYLFRMLHLAGYKAFVAGHVVVEHRLSVLDNSSMTEARYRNLTEAGSAFCDSFRGPLVGLEFTYRLIRSYLGQRYKTKDRGKQAILKAVIRKRLLLSKAKRLQEWTRQEGDRDTTVSIVATPKQPVP